MTIITGVVDATYLAQFLGKKIAIRDRQDKNKYYLYPKLYSITCREDVLVEDKDGMIHTFRWSDCASPYGIIMDHEVIQR